MDDYPYPYIAHSRPFVLLSGLNSTILERDGTSLLSNGPRIACQASPIKDDRVQALETAFLKFDPGDKAGDASSSSLPLSSNIFRVKSCGRQYTLPCRKASPLASEVGANFGSPGSLTLRSTLSPLSPASPLYMDGVMTPLWLMKYHDAVPAAFICFLSIGFDADNDSLNDNRLKAEINSLKTNLSDTNYGISLVVVLVADQSLAKCPNVDERLANIRKITKLENGTNFFMLPYHVESSDFGHFAQSVLSSIRPMTMDFYKNHYKKARRKKDKSVDSGPTTPTMEGINQTLSKTGWMIRSEYKMAIFSEFRFDMDAAARHHQEAIDLMMEPGGLFDLYPFWSPRWNELRLLADTCAMRRIRCLLANGLTSSAARCWRQYRYRTKQLLQRKGKGTSTYGWKAWEARFAKCMAEIIQSMFRLVTDASARKMLEVISPKIKFPFAPAEKSMQAERLAPWEYLHHPGYWLHLSTRFSEARRHLSKQIPKEDRIPPGQSPATRVARRSELFDTFLCPEPHVEGHTYDHAAEIMDLLGKTIYEFSDREQLWMADRLRVRLAYVRNQEATAGSNEFEKCWKYNKWRETSWYPILQYVATIAHSLARDSGDFKTQVLTLWELLDSRFEKSDSVDYDINKLVEQANDLQLQQETTLEVAIANEETVSFLNLNLCFEKESENLGEPLRAQLSLYSNAHKDGPKVTLSSITIGFNGNFPDIKMVHSAAEQQQNTSSSIWEIDLENKDRKSDCLVVEADLNIEPQQTKVFTLNMATREPGKISAATAVAAIEKEALSIKFTRNLELANEGSGWLLIRNGRLCLPRLLSRAAYREIEILPRLPKLKIQLPNLADKYYVDECISLELELINDEAYEVSGSLEVRFSGTNENEAVSIKIIEDETSKDQDRYKSDPSSNQDVCPFESLMPSMHVKKIIVVKMPSAPSSEAKLDLEVRYHQTGQAENGVSKTTSVKIEVVEPFKTSFGVTPDLHPDPWPSFFGIPEEPADVQADGKSSAQRSGGISSRWIFQPCITSIAEVGLIVEKIEVDLHGINDGTLASVLPNDAAPTTIEPGQDYNVDIRIDVTKQELEDVNPSIINPTLSIHWRRADAKQSETFRKLMLGPRLNLPSSEPRVVATLDMANEESIKIQIHLENPSLHYLSFEVGIIEGSDDFAFSGPSLTEVHLVPYSRLTVPFILIPMVRGTWLQPMFKVVDLYFNKSLRINAGKGLLKEHSTGALIVWAGS